MKKAVRHCKERGQLRKASVGLAGGEAFHGLGPGHCSAERLCGGWEQREPEHQTLSWGCHAGSEGPQLHGCPTQSSFAMCYSPLVHAKNWKNNQKHRFSTLGRKPECSTAQTDLEAALPYGVGCCEVFHEQISLCTHRETPCSGHLN